MACQDGPVPHPTVPVYFAALPRIKTGGGQTSSVHPSSTSPDGLLDAADHCSHGIEAALRSLQFLAQLRHAAPEVAPKMRARLAAGLQAARAVASAPPSSRSRSPMRSGMPVPSTLSHVLDPPSLVTSLALRCFQAGEEHGPLMLACPVPCHHQQPRVATRVLLLHKVLGLLGL